MKEANPVNIRFGISNLSRSGNASPMFYTFDKRFRLELIFYKLFFWVFECEMYYTIINPTVLFINSKLVVYFYFYVTQFTTRRLRVRVRRAKKRNLELMSTTTPHAEKQHIGVKKNTLNKLFGININTQSTTINKNERLAKRPPQSKLLLQMYKRVAKKKLEQVIFKITGSLSRCFFKSVFSLFRSKYSLGQRYQSYVIYNRFFYYHRTDNYIDTINIILFTLKYKTPNFIISFVCREIERTRYHNRLLKMIKQILVEFYENTKIFTGLKFLIRGPVNKHARTKRILQVFGTVPSQTFSQNVEYFNFYSNTKFGTIGLRLWVY